MSNSMPGSSPPVTTCHEAEPHWGGAGCLRFEGEKSLMHEGGGLSEDLW